MNNKKLLRLTEADLHRIVKESVNNVLNEHDYRNDPLIYILHLTIRIINFAEFFEMAGEKDDFDKMRRYGDEFHKYCVEFIKKYDELVSNGVI